MYLHKDREMFKDVVEQTAEQSGRTPIIVEKDYYVTLILKLLAEQLDLCVFKGGNISIQRISRNQSFFRRY